MNKHFDLAVVRAEHRRNARAFLAEAQPRDAKALAQRTRELRRAQDRAARHELSEFLVEVGARGVRQV